MKEKKLDLTTGVIWKQLVLFALPILATSLFQQLYTTVDAIIVGQYCGKTGLAAIDSVGNLLKLPVNLLVGTSSGAAIIISQQIGGNKAQEVEASTHTAIAFAIAGGIILSLTGVLSSPFLLELVDIPEDIYTETLFYIQIYYGGLAASMLFNIEAGILRANGDSKTPFYILLISGAVNIVLDFIFISILSWGVAGAAFATVLSQLCSALMALYILSATTSICKISIKKIRFHNSSLKQIIFLGLPVGLQQSLYPVANIMIQTSINGTGTDNIAAWALCGKLDFLIWLCVDALSVSVATFIAQNYGAMKYNRVRKGVGVGISMAAGITISLSAILFFWSEPIGKLFINAKDYDIIPLTGELMRFLAPFYFTYVFGEIFASTIRGCGDTFRPMLLTLLGTCVTRILWILFVVPIYNNIKVTISSYIVSWILTSLLMSIYYFFFRKKIAAVN